MDFTVWIMPCVHLSLTRISHTALHYTKLASIYNQPVWVMPCHSFHIEVNKFYWSVFNLKSIGGTNSDLYIISCGGGQLYIEPWW